VVNYVEKRCPLQSIVGIAVILMAKIRQNTYPSQLQASINSKYMIPYLVLIIFDSIPTSGDIRVIYSNVGFRPTMSHLTINLAKQDRTSEHKADSLDSSNLV
jgi:hypothetical protein